VSQLSTKKITADEAAQFMEDSVKTSEVVGDGVIAVTCQQPSGQQAVLVQGLGDGFLLIETFKAC
jgi:hypothetical protein